MTGISYGQLYRWKRKNIIPEEWFIKKSSYTGQETFFPREKMLSRIDAIKEMKDGYSLDELSEFFSPNPTRIEIDESALRSYRILTDHTFALCSPLLPQQDTFEFPDILNMMVIEKAEQLRVPPEDQRTLFQFLHEQFTPLKESSLELVGLRKEGTVIWLLLPLQANIYFDPSATVAWRFDLQQMTEELKITLSDTKGM
ncbi:hypothetical protein KH172YL63_08740 [Bacillus sp. KH172YL63]|nr:hypothetical protein KH172YL63_08740 [Bacillus sp. KH172YL63]